jgi:hypothetical protein
MTLLEAVTEIERLTQRIRATYPDAFPKPLPYNPNEKRMPSRFAWEVRVCSGVAKLEEAVARLKSAVAEADPAKLVETEASNAN